MIRSRELYYEERDPHPLTPKREPKPAEPAPKYAIIVRKDLGREGIGGHQTWQAQAIDEDTGEIIATKKLSQIGVISASRLIAIENGVARIAQEKGYTVKYEKGDD